MKKFILPCVAFAGLSSSAMATTANLITNATGELAGMAAVVFTIGGLSLAVAGAFLAVRIVKKGLKGAA